MESAHATSGSIEGYVIEQRTGLTRGRYWNIDERSGFKGGTVIRKTFMYIPLCSMGERDSAGIHKLAHFIWEKSGFFFRYHVNTREK